MNVLNFNIKFAHVYIIYISYKFLLEVFQQKNMWISYHSTANFQSYSMEEILYQQKLSANGPPLDTDWRKAFFFFLE